MALERRTPQTTEEQAGEAVDRDRHPEHCVPQEILAKVVRTKVCTEGRACRTVRVAGRVKEVDRCGPELIQARVEAGEHAWEVTALFRVVLKVDTEHGDRTVRTMLFYRASIPFPPHSGEHDHGECSGMEALVQISDLACNTTLSEDCYTLEVELTFLVTVYALESEIITVCRLQPHHPH